MHLKNRSNEDKEEKKDGAHRSIPTFLILKKGQKTKHNNGRYFKSIVFTLEIESFLFNFL